MRFYLIFIYNTKLLNIVFSSVKYYLVGKREGDCVDAFVVTVTRSGMTIAAAAAADIDADLNADNTNAISNSCWLPFSLSKHIS